MSKGSFSEELKRDAVAKITERGYAALQQCGGSAHCLHK